MADYIPEFKASPELHLGHAWAQQQDPEQLAAALQQGTTWHPAPQEAPAEDAGHAAHMLSFLRHRDDDSLALVLVASLAGAMPKTQEELTGGALPLRCCAFKWGIAAVLLGRAVLLCWWLELSEHCCLCLGICGRGCSSICHRLWLVWCTQRLMLMPNWASMCSNIFSWCRS